MPPESTLGVLTIGQCGALACLLEVTAAKPGNVYRGADFPDLTYVDLAASGILLGSWLEEAQAGGRVGPLVHAAVQQSRGYCGTNSNLGIALLLVPLARVPRGTSLQSGIGEVLDDLDEEDAEQVYAAIRLAQPGGLGEVPQADVCGPAPADLRAAMELAADRDLVARQYVTNFSIVLEDVRGHLESGLARGWPLCDAIVRAHLELMAEYPDSLIARKGSAELATEAAARARQVLELGLPGQADYQAGLGDFDFWLRSDGNRRNPGTTADLIAAGLFAALREGAIEPPLRFYGR